MDDDSIIYVSPVHGQTYDEFVEADNLGGASGYFISREYKSQFEVLAKATNIDSAREIFSLLTKKYLAS